MKRLLISLIAAAAGIASLLAGLGIDAWLHAKDPTLAEREGIFTLSNPGHLLLGLGVLLACGGVLCALHAAWGLAHPRGWLGRPYVRSMFLAWAAVASVSAVVFAMGISADGHDHAHAEAAPVQSSADAAHVHDAGAGAPAIADPSSTTHDHSGSSATAAGHQHGAPVDATPDEIACGNQLVQDTKAATARFADFSVAVAEGYRASTTNPNATHFGNPAYRTDGSTLDLAHPASLVYFTNPKTGEKTLLGALFIMRKGEAGPQPCGPVTYWHTHASCRKSATDIIQVESGATCPAGYRYTETAQMMHVWFVPGRKNGVAPTA